MLRTALVLSAGLLATLCFACVAVVPPSPTAALAPAPGYLLGGPGIAVVPQGVPTIVSRPRALAACADGVDPGPFLNKVYTLPNTFDPSNNTAYVVPVGVMQVANQGNWLQSNNLEQFTNDLRDAYCQAAPTFRKQLNDLTNVFITCATPAACVPIGQDIFGRSWGYRENATNQSVLQHTYIALSADLWPVTLKQSPPAFSQFEYGILDNLLMIAPPPDPQPITIVANPDTSTLTVLAALAHEVGHIYWRKLDVSEIDCGGPFSGYSWDHADVPRQFHRFGEEQPYANGHGNQPKNRGPDKDNVKQDIMSNNGNVYRDLRKIYNGNWASLFATVAPDEDFIETYKLWTLMSAGLSSLQITIPPGSSPPVGDMVAFMKLPPLGSGSPATQLSQKNQWIQSCFLWPPSP
jgi:hypothetical protein